MKPRLHGGRGQRAPDPPGPSPYPGAPEWTVVGHHLKEPSSSKLREPAFGRGSWGQGPGEVSPPLTAALQCTVVEGSPGISSVAPGPVAIPVWVPAEVLLQLCVWGGGRREPRQEGEQNHSMVIPRPRWAPVLRGHSVPRLG